MEVVYFYKEGKDMASISGLNMRTNFFGTSTSGVNTLFGSLNNNSSSQMTSMLSDYASIKSGSYGKLLNTYYGKNSAHSTTSADKNDKKDEVKIKNSTSSSLLKEAKTAANDLKSSISKLTKTGEDSIFAKKEIKGEDGKTTTDYDKDAIYKAVSDYVKNYNATIDATNQSGSTTVTNAGKNMTSLTGAMSRSLSKIGITMGVDSKLSINEDDFKKADMNSVKTLFNGNSSYANNIGTSASMVENSASNQLSMLNGSMYGSDGAYGSNYAYSGSLYASYF